MNPQVVAPTECVVGENPLWSPIDEKIFWCDIPSGKIYRYDPATGRHSIVYDDKVIGGFTIQGDGTLLLFGEDGQIVHWDNGKTSTIVQELPAVRGTRFNDVQVDPHGGIFCGTMPSEKQGGKLYHLSRDQSVDLIESDLAIPNGMGFSPDLEYMYLTESEARTIWRYSYDASKGNLSQKERFVQIEGDGVPDGLTVDNSGAVWSARWNGNALMQYDDSGERLRTVQFPTKKVSSVTFGGTNNDCIFVSTAGGDDPDTNGSLAGSLFRLHSDSIGQTQFLSDIVV